MKKRDQDFSKFASVVFDATKDLQWNKSTIYTNPPLQAAVVDTPEHVFVKYILYSIFLLIYSIDWTVGGQGMGEAQKVALWKVQGVQRGQGKAASATDTLYNPLHTWISLSDQRQVANFVLERIAHPHKLVISACRGSPPLKYCRWEYEQCS